MLKLEQKVWPNYGINNNMGLLGDPVAVKRLRDQVKRIGPTDVSILIYGESGSGKETIARLYSSNLTISKAISNGWTAVSEMRIEAEVFGISAQPTSSLYAGRADGAPSCSMMFWRCHVINKVIESAFSTRRQDWDRRRT